MCILPTRRIRAAGWRTQLPPWVDRQLSLFSPLISSGRTLLSNLLHVLSNHWLDQNRNPCQTVKYHRHSQWKSALWHQRHNWYKLYLSLVKGWNNSWADCISTDWAWNSSNAYVFLLCVCVCKDSPWYAWTSLAVLMGPPRAVGTLIALYLLQMIWNVAPPARSGNLTQLDYLCFDLAAALLCLLEIVQQPVPLGCPELL